VCVCVCVCVCGHILWGVEAPHSPGPGSFESCWLFLERPGGSWAEPAGLGLIRRLASRWHQAGGERGSLTAPSQKKKGEATPPLCSPGWHAAGVFLYREVFSAAAAAAASTDNLSLWNFERTRVYWSDVNSTGWATETWTFKGSLVWISPERFH